MTPRPPNPLPSFSRRSLVAGVAGLVPALAAAQGTPVAPVAPVGASPRVSIPVWPERESDLYGPVATVEWARLLSAATLLSISAAGTLVGGIGLVPVLSADRTRLELDIRPDALFANNSPVRVEDVLASLHLAWARGIQGKDAWRWRNIDAIVEEEQSRIAIILDEPDASIPALLASWRTPILPAAWIAATNRRAAVGPPPAAGMFQLREMSADQLRWTRNSGFYQVGRPRLPGLTCHAPTMALARGTSLVTGDVDLLINAPLLDIPMLRENPGISLVGGSTNALTLLKVNVASHPLRDRRLRSLLAATISREPLIAAAVAGEGRLATTLIPPDLWAGLEMPEAPLEAATARDELEGLGILPGIELRLVAPIGDASLANACVQLQDQFAWAGFALALDLLSGAEMERELRTGRWDLLITALPWWHDPQELIWPLLTTGGPLNHMGYASNRVDYLAALASRARGEEERGALYRSIQEIVARDVPVIPLYFGNYYDAMTVDLVDYPFFPPESAGAMAQARLMRPSAGAHPVIAGHR